ncbi:CPBP family glutamic-type intramembrane protease [Qipengyuania flava]|uniref:CPBP family glutamic-type intramembrane protease n=1 Tax=Qipengyuania flava TaxID=192812 RepID=UPI001C636CF8|nr:CPBP family glutamic-type intramembrane protease [Qipengyuania flava]QYJ07063.1 CPBP family intramembrane metalloprotease [Qipengyuania flava]
MNAGTTSLAPANSLRAEWGQLARFLKRPTLPARAAPPRLASLVALGRLLMLDFAAMIVLLAIAGTVMSTGVDVPETALAGVEIGSAIIFAVVIGAPVVEEILFRGWLSGRPGHVLALLAFGLGAVGITMLLALSGFSYGTDALESGLAAMGIGVIGGALIAGIVLFLLRGRPPMGWFSRAFPVFFWLSTFGFSLIHLFNFEPDEMTSALPLVLPQFITGMLLGYARVHYGLWSSMLLHALHNGAFISLVLWAGSAAG